MDNHFHILVRVWPDSEFSDEEIQQRFEAFYGDSRVFVPGLIGHYRQKWSSLSEYVKTANPESKSGTGALCACLYP